MSLLFGVILYHKNNFTSHIHDNYKNMNHLGTFQLSRHLHRKYTLPHPNESILS
jgi:hypothetical protein